MNFLAFAIISMLSQVDDRSAQHYLQILIPLNLDHLLVFHPVATEELDNSVFSKDFGAAFEITKRISIHVAGMELDIPPPPLPPRKYILGQRILYYG